MFKDYDSTRPPKITPVSCFTEWRTYFYGMEASCSRLLPATPADHSLHLRHGDKAGLRVAMWDARWRASRSWTRHPLRPPKVHFVVGDVAAAHAGLVIEVVKVGVRVLYDLLRRDFDAAVLAVLGRVCV